MAFDIEGARKAGYSEGEIADYLGQESGFDTAAALKSGYTPEDVISHLTAAPEPAKQPAVEAAPPAEEKSFLSSVGDNLTTLAKGVGSALNPVVGRSLNIAQGPKEKKINSVLEGVQMRDVPFDPVEADRLSRKDYAQEVETREAQAKYPSIKEWRAPILSDRQKFAEQNPVTAGFAQSAASTLAGTLNVPSVAAGLVGEAGSKFAKTIGAPDYFGRTPNMPLVDDLKSISQEYSSQLSRKSPGKAWDDGDFGRWMMTQLSGNSFSAAQSLGALFVPGAQASLLASMGGISAGNAYAEGDSASAATLKGLVEAGSEMLPLKAAEGIKDIVLSIPTPVRGQVLAEAGKRLLAAGTAITTNSMVGAIEEVAAEIGGNAIDKYVSGKNKSLFEDVDRAAIVGAAFGTAFSGPAVAETLSSPQARAARELSRGLQAPQTAPVETSVFEALRTGQTNGVNIDPVATTLSAAAAKRVEHERAVAEIGTAQTVDQAIEAAQRAVEVAPESTESIAQRIREIEESQSAPAIQMEQPVEQVAPNAVADMEIARDGSLRIIGDTQAIAAQLKAAGVSGVIPTESGVVVGPAQAVQAQTILGVADGAGNGRVESPAIAQGTGASQQVGSQLDAGVLARPEGIGAGFAQRPLPQAVATPSEPANAQPALAQPLPAEIAKQYSPASPRQQTVASQLQARIRATYPAADFNAVGIPSGKVGKAMSEAADTAKRLFGIDVNYVKFNGAPLFDGVRSEAFPNTIFLRADAPKPHMAVLGHELLHEMRGTTPKLYADLGTALDALIKNDTQYAADLARRYESRGGKLPSEWREELHADIVGDNFADPQFWAELSREKPDLFTRLANAVRQFLNRILLRAKPFGTDAYLRDVQAARDVVSSAMQKFRDSRTKQPAFSVDAATAQAQNQGYANEPTNRGTGAGAVDADGYRTASASHQQLADQLLQRVQRGYPNARFHAVDAPDGLRGQSLVAARTTGKRLFRQDVVFVQFDGPPLFNGAVSDSIPGVVFVRADTDKPHMSILGHELLHQLRKETPGLYDQLAARLGKMVENESAYASQLAARYERQGGQLPAEWREELYADIVGDNFSNPDFWEAMAKDQPGLFQRVAEAIRKFLDNVLSRAEPFATGQYLRDVAAARDAVVDAMRQFSGTQVGALTSQVDGVAMSVASQPETSQRFSEDNTNSNGQPIASTTEALKNFRKWFGDSKVVDAKGRPLVVYHGTSKDFPAFDKNLVGRTFGTDKQGLFFTSNPNEAAKYADMSEAIGGGFANVMPVYVRLKNPYIAFVSVDSSQQEPARWFDDRKYIVEEAIASGNDGVIVENENGEKLVIAFRPDQIKSAIGNRGTYDPSNPDIRYSFAGESANTSDAMSLESAKERLAAGEDAEIVRQDTGWHRGVDGRMRFEINDSDAKLISEPSDPDVYADVWDEAAQRERGVPLSIVLDHPALFAAYPRLRAMRVKVDSSNKNAGMYSEDDRAIVVKDPYDYKGRYDELLSVLLHEIQHGIQAIEGFATGANPAVDGENNYLRSAGEVEARNTSARKNLTAAERKATAPGKTADIPDADAIVTFNGRVAANAPPPANAKPISRQQDNSQEWAIPEESRIDRMIYEMQDSRVDLKRVQESIKEANRTIEEKFDARQAESLFPGRVAYRADDFLKSEVRPLLQAMALSKISMNELADYLHARGAEERNAQIARINPDMPDGGAGTNTQGVLMTNQAAQDYIKSLPADRVKVLDSLAAKVDAITKGTRDLLVNEGLEKREVIDAWEAAYKNYVPMFRDEAESGNPHPSGGGFSVRGGNSKRATGSTKNVTNILAHVLMQREAAITKAEKNRVGLSLYGLALTNPNPEFWATIRPGMQVSQIAADLKAMGVDPVVAEAGMQGVPTVRTVDTILDRVVDRANPMYKSLPGALTVKINGEDRVLMFNEKDPRALRMAESLKNLDGLTRFDLAGSMIGKTTRWMAAVNTQYNPAFGIVNGIRDTFGGAVNLTSTPLRGKSSKVLLDAYAKAGPAIGKELASPGGQSEWAKLYRQFKEDGGQTGYREMFKDANDRSRAIENELKLLEKAGKLTPGKAATAMLNLLDGFNTTIENAVRLSAYKNALDQGMSRAASAKLARELTVDFNRKGRAGRELGPLYAFFNASVQGTARTIEAIKGPAGAKIITGGLVLGALQPLLLAMAGFDDDEIPEFIKTRAFIIPLAGTEKRFIAVPLPLGLHVIPNTGRVIAELAMNGGKDIGKRTFEAIGEVAGAFNPLGGGNIFTADGALRTVSPTITDPLIEIGFNKNFAGSQIERGERGETDVRPGFARAKESTQRALTGQAYLGISKAINKLSGGSDYEAGLVSPTPERLNYLAQVVGGGVLREIEKTINLTDKAANDEKVQQNKLPVIGRLFGQVDEDSVSKSRYFEASKKLDKAQAALKAAQKAGDVEAVRKMLDASPELMLGQTQDKIAQEIAKLNKVAVITIDDREKLKQLDEVRLVYMKMLNDAVRQQELQSGKPTPGQRLREYAKTKREEAANAGK